MSCRMQNAGAGRLAQEEELGVYCNCVCNMLPVLKNCSIATQVLHVRGVRRIIITGGYSILGRAQVVYKVMFILVIHTFIITLSFYFYN